MSTFAKFDRYVERHARSFTERLQNLCRMPSVAARATGMRAIAETVEQSMQRVGMGTRSFRMGSGYPIIYGECGSGPKTFMVYGHYDVQPVGHLTDWSTGPFAAEIRDEKLYARGAANSKGDLIARLAAVEAYQKSFGKLPVTLRFIVEGEDGLGSPSLYRFTDEHPEMLQADGCLWDEGSRDTKENPIVSLGFKGITFLELRSFGARTDLHSKWGAIVPNPAWRLVQALATITSPKGVITIDGFSSYIAPISDEDAEVLKAIELDEVGLKREFRISGWVRAMKGAALVKEHIFGPTCTICGIHTGHTEAGAKTVLPSMAMARLDFRLVPDLTAQIVADLLRAHLDVRGFKDIEIIELGSAPLAKSSSKSRVARAVIDSTQEVYGKPALIYPMDPSSGPVGAVCGVSQPPTPVASFGTSYAGSNPHGPDENIRIDDFIQSIKLVGRVIHKLAASRSKPVSESGEEDRKPTAPLPKLKHGQISG
ncbi:MAG TPA: M20/M25/M40 family metallo-hydrolase [Pyrinomonadaceae bacterium]|jgi:acetylornithine deacetylase/succinyl-diaminopimelate desuccinylase-like protein|nr:M20/M25/M40 family metallo-hydrolase [Pyrinomonadaceae bacterium]